jgi:hypothetical protein
MMSASALLGVMAFLIAHERIRTPNEKYSSERVASSRFFEQQDARMFTASIAIQARTHTHT